MPRACSNVQGQCLGICCELCSTNQTKLLRMRHCNGSVCVLFYWHLVSFQHLLYQILSPLGRRQRSQSGLSGVWSARGCWMVGRVDLAKRGWWVKRWLGDHWCLADLWGCGGQPDALSTTSKLRVCPNNAFSPPNGVPRVQGLKEIPFPNRALKVIWLGCFLHILLCCAKKSSGRFTESTWTLFTDH